MIVGLFGGTLNAMIIANVPPNLPTIAWAATLDPGYHSFSKWAIHALLVDYDLKRVHGIKLFSFHVVVSLTVSVKSLLLLFFYIL